ncbi:hypothetical protein CCU68_29870 [Pseudomonas gingeri NCPPB 3146 = LMG 5327]|uniref:Uncharacterized protein n=2 Tax=Pseudomonas gingeri TaxID=117681 RepID=A0A7Y7XYV4_9PSED|nr:hypothetical protein [Pseudomonas gingeri]NVZ23990.1 hypothetical protein [Pseudomonas gingeri]NWC13928.1 hypothetical protein [Pseudomonas gingeri]NWE48453.1 hypothetical protein [Pseudomonas gingeri]NWE72809.1 hypothetical protein [Pseudomonas gingeri]PNQ88871.1 hypothetical protein CCU68_29870 [Pseudomonas gingeri NCPPB 3146 = LMG 5327]
MFFRLEGRGEASIGDLFRLDHGVSGSSDSALNISTIRSAIGSRSGRTPINTSSTHYVQPVTGQVMNTRCLPEQASRAHADIAARRITGSIILTP